MMKVASTGGGGERVRSGEEERCDAWQVIGGDAFDGGERGGGWRALCLYTFLYSWFSYGIGIAACHGIALTSSTPPLYTWAKE